MGAMASQITSLTIVYSTVYSGADQSKHQSSASLAFVWGIHRGPVNSPHKWPVTRKMFPFDDVIMDRDKNGHHSADITVKFMFSYENWHILIQISRKFVSKRQVPNKQQTDTGLDNGLALYKRQTIIWNNCGLVYWHICASLGLCDLISDSVVPQVSVCNPLKLPWEQGSWGQHGAHLGRQDPGGPHVGPMNLVIWVVSLIYSLSINGKTLCSIHRNQNNSRNVRWDLATRG